MFQVLSNSALNGGHTDSTEEGESDESLLLALGLMLRIPEHKHNGG
jgi:hypothetical protein